MKTTQRAGSAVLNPVATASFLLRSNSNENFINPIDAKRDISSFNPEDFRFHWDTYCTPEDAINVADVRRVVVGTLGPTQPGFIVDKFVFMARRLQSERMISWTDFSKVVDDAIKIVGVECGPKREKPHVMASKIILDKGLGSGERLSTNYRDNFEKSHLYVEKPTTWTRADETVARPLISGSSKGTYHIPGYMGHIPRNILNPRKKTHSEGASLHAVQNDLMLTRKGCLGSMGGYAGHLPAYTVMTNERVTGTDMRSTQGAAFGGEKLII